MKQVSTLLILLTGFIQLQGQTINPAYFVQLGQETQTAYVTNSQIFETPEEGLDGLWDFSEAEYGGNDDYYIYQDPQSFTWADSFPNASIGAVDVNKGFYHNYFQVEDSNLLYWGYTTETNTGAPLQFIYSDPVNILACPLQFGSSFDDDFSYTVYFDGEFLNEHFGTRTTTFAGVGTVITPSGTFYDCTMLKIEDTGGGGEPFVAYNFYKGSMSNIVASYIERGLTISGELGKLVSYQIENLNTTATENISEINTDLIVLNNGTLQFNSKEAREGQLAIYTTDGKLLSNEKISFYKGSNIISLNHNIHGLSFGILTDTKSKRFKTFKIIL